MIMALIILSMIVHHLDHGYLSLYSIWFLVKLDIFIEVCSGQVFGGTWKVVGVANK